MTRIRQRTGTQVARLPRRGFRGVKLLRLDIARPFSCDALMQAGMPAVQSVPKFPFIDD